MRVYEEGYFVTAVADLHQPLELRLAGHAPKSVLLTEGVAPDGSGDTAVPPPIGTFRNAGYKFDRWHDVAYWHLALCAPPKRPDEPRLWPDASQ